MKKSLGLLFFVCVAALFTVAGSSQTDYQMPTLHTIHEATLSPSYSCRSKDEFQTGYDNTALFLSGYSKRRNSPDLLFNGACGSIDYFQSSTAGDDMALIADLGDKVTLEELTAHKIFNLENVHRFSSYTKFSQVVAVEPNHAYAVLLNKENVRGLFVFVVTDYEKNKRVSIRYAVKEYQVDAAWKASSPGFGWEKTNTVPTDEPAK